MRMAGIAMRRRILMATHLRQDPADQHTFLRRVILMPQDSWLDPCLHKQLLIRARR